MPLKVNTALVTDNHKKPLATQRDSDDHPPLAKKPCLDIPNGLKINDQNPKILPKSISKEIIIVKNCMRQSPTPEIAIQNAPKNSLARDTSPLPPLVNGHSNPHSRPPSASPLMSSPPPILDPPKINQSPPHPTSNHQHTNNTNNINYHANNYRESDHNTTASEQNSIIPEDERQQPANASSFFPASPPNLKSQHKSLVKEAKNLKNEEHKLNSKISTLRSTIHESQLNIRAIDAQFQNQRLDQFENGGVQEEGGEDKTGSLPESGADSKLVSGNSAKTATNAASKQQQVNNLAIFFEQLIQHAKILTKMNSDEATTSSNSDAAVVVGASENGSNSPDSQNSKIESQNFPLSSLETIFNKHPPTTAIPANLLDKIGQFSDRKITTLLKNYDKTELHQKSSNETNPLSSPSTGSTSNSNIASSSLLQDLTTLCETQMNKNNNTATSTTSYTQIPPADQLNSQLFLVNEHISKTQNLVENKRWDLEKKTRKIHSLKAASSLLAKKKRLKKSEEENKKYERDMKREPNGRVKIEQLLNGDAKVVLGESQNGVDFKIKKAESDKNGGKIYDRKNDDRKKSNDEVLNGDLMDDNSNESSKSIGITEKEQLASRRLDELKVVSEEFRDLRLETIAGHLKNESYFNARTIDRDGAEKFLFEANENIETDTRRKRSSETTISSNSCTSHQKFNQNSRSTSSESESPLLTDQHHKIQHSVQTHTDPNDPKSLHNLEEALIQKIVHGNASLLSKPTDLTHSVLLDQFNAVFDQAQYTNSQNDEITNQFKQRYSDGYLKQYESIVEDQQKLENELIKDIKEVEQQYLKHKLENDKFLLEYERLSSALEVSTPINEEMREILVLMQEDISGLKTQLNITKSRLKDVYRRVKTDLYEKQNRPEEVNEDSGFGVAAKQKQSKLKKKHNELVDAKSLLDCYKTFLKDGRSKSEINQVIKKLDEELKGQNEILSGKKIPPIADELLKKVETVFNQNDSYSTDVCATSQALENQQISNLTMLQQLREKNVANFHLHTKKIRMQSIIRLSDEERKILIKHVGTQKELNVQQMNIIQASDERNKLYMLQATHSHKQINMMQMSGDELKKAQNQTAVSVRNQLTKIQDLSKKQDADFQTVQKLVNKACDNKFDNIRKEEQIKSLKKLENRIKAEKKVGKKAEDSLNQGGDGMDQMVIGKKMSNLQEKQFNEFQREHLRTKLLCKICKTREKDAMLLKCKCVFCEVCLKDRYSKKKKSSVCPSSKCKHPFVKGDILKIYLT